MGDVVDLGDDGLWRDASEVWHEWLRVEWLHFFNLTQEDIEFGATAFQLLSDAEKCSGVDD